MTLKIERISGKRRTRIRLSGAFRSEHVDQVKAEGIPVLHCSPYIREWMLQERSRPKDNLELG
jgi:hypothetical protein